MIGGFLIPIVIPKRKRYIVHWVEWFQIPLRYGGGDVELPVVTLRRGN